MKFHPLYNVASWRTAVNAFLSNSLYRQLLLDAFGGTFDVSLSMVWKLEAPTVFSLIHTTNEGGRSGHGVA